MIPYRQALLPLALTDAGTVVSIRYVPDIDGDVRITVETGLGVATGTACSGLPMSPARIPPPTRVDDLEPTPVPAALCVGDCDTSGAVTVDDLITVVRVALGEHPLAQCAACDPDGSGQVAIDEVVMAVDAALGGCARSAALADGG